MAEGLNYQINITGNANESVGSLKKQLREAQNEVAALSDKFGATSKEAIEAAKRAAELRDRIGDARALTEAFNPDAKFKALTASLSGVAGGFAALQGAIGLFGAENKELEKQLLKVQSALALSQGLQAIGESIDSFKQLGAVIQSTTVFTRANAAANTLTAATMRGLGIAVDVTSTSFRVLKGVIAATGIGLAVIAIGELISALSSWSSASDKAAESQKKLNEETKKSADLVLETELASITRTEELLKAQAKLRGASEAEIFKIEQDSRKLRIRARERYVAEVGKIDFEAGMKAENQLKNEQNTLRASELNFLAEEKKRKEDAEKERQRKAKEQLEQLRKEQKERNDILRNQIADENKAFLKSVDDQREQVIKSTNAIVQGSLEANLKAIGIQSNAKKKAAQDEQELDDTKLKYEEEKRKAYAMTADALGVLGQVVGQETAAGKALSSAQALINTFLGITQVWANKTVIPEPFGTAQKIAATATTAASGFLAVRNINRVQVPKGGGGVSVPSFNSPLSPSNAANLTTNLSQATINAIGNQAIRAYVVETDITTNQQRVQAIRQRARFR